MVESTSEPHLQLTEFVLRLLDELQALERRIATMEKQIQDEFTAVEACQRIAQAEEFALIATAIVAAVADGKAFHNGRQLAAWLDLVPRQHFSGEKQRPLVFPSVTIRTCECC